MVSGSTGSIASTTGAVALLALMRVGDRIERRVRTMVICGLVASLFPAVMAALARLDPSLRTPAVVFSAIVVLALVEQSVGALHGMVQSSLLVRTVQVNIRGCLMGSTV